MTKAEQKQIEREMRELADRASHKVGSLCATISLPYELEALKVLRKQIDYKIEAIETLMKYSEENKT